MKTRLRVHLVQFTVVFALAVLAVGCPEKEDEPKPDAGEQTDVGEDVADDTGSDAGMDAEQDAADDGGGEMAANCVVEGVAPRTFSIDAADNSLEITLACDSKPAAGQILAGAFLRRFHARDSAELSTDGIECTADGELQRCVWSLSGLATPSGTYDEVVGPEDLVIEDKSGQQFDVRVHWHVPNGQLEGLQRERDLLMLPAGYAERGLEYAVKQTTAGRLISGVMATENRDGVEMFTVAPDGTVSVDSTIAVDVEKLAASGFEMAKVGSGLGAFWWALDDGEGQFLGGQTIYMQGGAVSTSVQLDSASYSGPTVAEVLGAEAGFAEIGGEIRMSMRVLTKTERGTLATLRLADAAGADRVALEKEFDALGGVAGADIEKGLAGMLASDRTSGDLDANRGMAWVAKKNGTVAFVPLSSTVATCSVTLTHVQYPFTLDAHLASDRRVVIASKDDGDDGTWEADVVEVERGTDGLVCGSTTHLMPPPGVDLTGTGGVIEANEPSTHTHLGNLSGTGTPVIVQWDLTAANEDVPAPVKMVRPAVAEEAAAGVGAADGDRALSLVGADGSMQLVKTDALRSNCTDASACAVPLTERTNRGWRLNLVPGDTGATWAVDKYGDILIDGVPLVFDLTAPPIIIDAPGATAQNDAAMILAGIDHESATHAVWTVDATGKLSQPGLLNLDTGDPNTGVVLTAAAGEDKGDDEQAQDMTLTIATVLIDFGADGSDSSNEQGAGTFSVTATQLAAAIGAADPVSFATDGPEFDISATATQAEVLAPAGAMVPDFSYQSGSDRADALIELSAEQAAKPLVLMYTDEGLKMRSSGDGDPPLDVLLDQDEPVSNDNPIFVGGGTVPETTIAGDSSRQNGPHFRTFNGLRYDHYSIGTHSNSSSDESGSTSSFGVSVVQAAFPSELAGEDVLILVSGDFNGDGLDDLVVKTRGVSGSTVVFSNGMGGFLPGVMTLSGGPTIEWPSGANASTSGNGKGTSKSASIVLQNIHLELL